MAQHPVAQQKRVALVVGNAAYAHAGELNNVAADARSIADRLREVGFNELALHENLSFEAMRRALQQFSRTAEDADMAVFYYAGHGIELDGENYLIPVDANLEHDRDVAFETVSLAQVLRAIDGAGTLRLAILDACRDNPFRTTIQRSGPSHTRSIGRGLADIEPSGNVLVAFSAKGGTVAFDGSGAHSPFAQALIDHLARPGLEIGFLFRQMRDAVLKATGQKQEPYLYGSLGAEPVYFVPEEAAPEETSKATEAAVFISYASADRDCAEDLARSLESEGYTVWWDTKLLGGQQYRKAILAQLDTARAAIVIWTKASVESDWVYDEASRARSAGKLIPIRVRELDPKEIQPPFGALHTVLLNDGAGVRAALAAHSVLPGLRAEKHPSSAPGPVDERTLEHDYWVAIQASKDPTDFETFLEKFAQGVYAPVARKRVETLIAEASLDLIAHFLREHPDSDHSALARERLVQLEWAKVEDATDPAKLRTFIARYPDSAEATRARSLLAKLEWERIRSSEDASEIEQVLVDLGDTNEAGLARRRLATLREEDAAWTRAAAANDAASLQQYLSAFPRGKHAAEVKTRLKAMRRAQGAANRAGLQLSFQAMPYWTIAIIAAAVGLLVAVLSQLDFYWILLGDVYLLSMHRALYVFSFVLLVATLTQTQNILKWIGVLVALYALETIFDTMNLTAPILKILWFGLVMLLEWLFVAALFVSLKDKIMMGIAGAIGAAQGAIYSVIDATLVGMPADLATTVVSFSTTALCLAYGIRRQSKGS
jgi:hypothetical protein